MTLALVARFIVVGEAVARKRISLPCLWRNNHNVPRRRGEPGHGARQGDHKFVIVLRRNEGVGDVLRRLQGQRPQRLVEGCEPGLLVALQERLKVIVDAKYDPELLGLLQCVGGGMRVNGHKYSDGGRETLSKTNNKNVPLPLSRVSSHLH